jgi:hypothetical protein
MSLDIFHFPRTERRRSMLSKKTTMALMFSVLVCGIPLAIAQGPRGGGGGWGPGSQYGRMYDPKTVETVAGEITKVEL